MQIAWCPYTGRRHDMQTDWFLLGILVQTQCCAVHTKRMWEYTARFSLGNSSYWLMSMLLLGVVAPSRGGLVVHSDNLTLETKLKIYENTVLHISTYDIGPEGAIDKFKTHQTKPRKAYNHCPIRSCSWCFFPSFCWRVSSLWAPRRCMLPRCFPAGCWR